MPLCTSFLIGQAIVRAKLPTRDYIIKERITSLCLNNMSCDAGELHTVADVML